MVKGTLAKPWWPDGFAISHLSYLPPLRASTWLVQECGNEPSQVALLSFMLSRKGA